MEYSENRLGKNSIKFTSSGNRVKWNLCNIVFSSSNRYDVKFQVISVCVCACMAVTSCNCMEIRMKMPICIWIYHRYLIIISRVSTIQCTNHLSTITWRCECSSYCHGLWTEINSKIMTLIPSQLLNLDLFSTPIRPDFERNKNHWKWWVRIPGVVNYFIYLHVCGVTFLWFFILIFEM